MSIDKVKIPRTVDINTSNEHVSFRVSFERDKWKTQLILNGNLKYPTIPSKAPLYELNESRNTSILKLLQTNKIEDDSIIQELMSNAGEKLNDLISLTNEIDEEVTSPDEKYDSWIVERATNILKDGNPFQFYMNKWKSCYAVTNDNDSIGAMTLCVIASTLISNSKGVHEKVGGPSGFGKSVGITRMFALLPPEKTFVSSMSAKALFYTDIPAGTVVYCDDVDLSKEDFFTTVKQSTSEYQQTTKHTTVMNGLSLKCSVNPRIGWILSSVDNFDDGQLDSRFGETEVSDDIDKQVAIHEKQKEEEFNTEKSGIIDDDILVCQCLWDILQQGGLYEIRIPFIKAITWADIKHPRNFPFFKDLIRCMTLFRIFQREKVNDFYLSTVEDYEAAKQIYKKMEKNNATKLNTNEIQILTYLKKQHQNFMNAIITNHYSNEVLATLGKVSRPSLIDAMSKNHKMTQQQVIYAIHGKNNNGGLLNKVVGLQAEKMINNVFGGGNSIMYYWFTGDINLEGFTDTIVLDTKQVEPEINEWKNKLQ